MRARATHVYMFSMAVLSVAEKRFLADALITDNMMQLQRKGQTREKEQFTNKQSRLAEGEGGGGCRDCGVCCKSGQCGHRIAIIRRAG